MAIQIAERRVRGRQCPEVLHEGAMRVLASSRSVTYEAHEFTVPTPVSTPTAINDLIDHTTDCTCGRASGFLGVIDRAERISIRNRGANSITVRFNDPTNDPITIEDGEAYDWDFTEIEDVFFENAGGQAVPIRVLVA